MIGFEPGAPLPSPSGSVDTQDSTASPHTVPASVPGSPLQPGPVPSPDPSPSLLGGGTGWRVHLPGWPLWGQNVDWTWQGATDVNRAENCIPEEVAAAIMYLRHVELPASFVKDVEYGESYTGYTDFEHAMDFLKRVGHVASHVALSDTAEQWHWYMWDALRRGKPYLGLYYFTANPFSGGHCRATIYMDASTIITADPWTASTRTEDYATNWAWAKGGAIVIDAVRWTRP